MQIVIENGMLSPASKVKISKIKGTAYFKQVPNWLARSYPQLQLYWSSKLKAYANHIEGFEKYVIEKDGNLNYDILHRELTRLFVLHNNRHDLVQVYHDLEGNQYAIVSISFDKMSRKDFNDYMNWVDLFFKMKTGITIAEAEYHNL